jgi:hypothetical protein
VSGSARHALATLASASGGHAFARDGVLYVIESDGHTGEPYTLAPVLSSRGGNLIGSPMPTDAGIACKCLLDPGLRPGRIFRVDASTHAGDYVARNVVFEGDSGFDAPFYATVTGRALPR